MNKAETIREWAISKVGCPYIFAANGQKCTPDYRRRQMENKPAYAANIKKYCPVLSGKQTTCAGCKYNGLPSYDCSGLTKEAAKLIGLAVPHGASSQWKGDYWDAKGTIDQMPQDRVCFVFNAMDSADPMGHVGVYLGDGYDVDARGHAQGVVHTKLNSYAWDHFGVLKGMYDEVITMPDTGNASGRDILRKGAKGLEVLGMQECLLAHGMPLSKYGADGDFGAETEAAVKAFQQLKGLSADGICGPLTWAALLKEPEDLPPQGKVYTVTIPGLTLAQADVLLNTYPGAAKTVG